MGLIALGKNVVGMAGQAIDSAFADSIKDYYRCEGMKEGVLMVPGTRVVREGGRNPGANDVISDGSVFDVSAGQCAIVLENGAIHDMVVCFDDEGTGQYQFKTDRVASFFGTDKFNVNLKNTLAQIAQRFTAGGQTMNTHRIIYINLRPVKGMKAGTGGVTFRDIEMNITLQIGVHGTFSYTIADPFTFYTSCINDSTRSYGIDSGDGADLHNTLKTALKSKLKSTFAIISQMQIPYDQIQGNTNLFIEAANKALGDSWSRYGILLDPAGSNFELDADEKSKKMIEDFQRSRAYGGNEAALRGQIVEGQLDAMKTAAGNSAGSTVGLMGMGLMGNMQGMMGTSQMVNPMQQPAQQQPVTPVVPIRQPGSPTVPTPPAASTDEQWICSCGAANTMRFCGNCGSEKPQPTENTEWICSCGAANTMKFCGNCGSPRPEPARNCGNCGWKLPEEGVKPKFCPNCGKQLSV